MTYTEQQYIKAKNAELALQTLKAKNAAKLEAIPHIDRTSAAKPTTFFSLCVALFIALFGSVAAPTIIGNIPGVALSACDAARVKPNFKPVCSFTACPSTIVAARVLAIAACKR